MYVANKMTTDLITIDPYQTISEALDLMQEHHIHRIPVVEDGKLLGLVTEGVVLKNTPSNASTLSIHEMNYLLSKTKIKDIMLKKVITITPEALLEEAADTMEKNNIGCLPVVNDQNFVVGIITTNDILKAFVSLLGYHRTGTRLVLEFEKDMPGIMAELTSVFLDANINMTHLTAHRNGKTEIVIRCDTTDQGFLMDLLMSKGYQVVSIL